MIKIIFKNNLTISLLIEYLSCLTYFKLNYFKFCLILRIRLLINNNLKIFCKHLKIYENVIIPSI